MGRSTPSYRMAVYKELDRLMKILELLPPRETSVIKEYLEDIEDTISLYTHQAAPIDPMEVIYLHIIRRMIMEIHKGEGG